MVKPHYDWRKAEAECKKLREEGILPPEVPMPNSIIGKYPKKDWWEK